jgi:hypothetical protein
MPKTELSWAAVTFVTVAISGHLTAWRQYVGLVTEPRCIVLSDLEPADLWQSACPYRT